MMTMVMMIMLPICNKDSRTTIFCPSHFLLFSHFMGVSEREGEGEELLFLFSLLIVDFSTYKVYLQIKVTILLKVLVGNGAGADENDNILNVCTECM